VVGPGGLAHLPLRIGEGHDPRPLTEDRLRLGERSPEPEVEPPRDPPRLLQVLDLVLPHRDVVGPVEEDVRRLEDRIVEQATVDELLLRGLLFELGHPRQIPVGGDTAQDPAQLRVLWDGGLDIEDRPLRVDPARDEVEGELPPRRAELGGHRVLVGESVVVDDAVDTLVPLLELDPALDRPEVVPDVELPCWLDA